MKRSLPNHFISFICVATLICCIIQTNAQTLAFPDAEGFGRFATGGRGGEVYIVTNLNDSGPGSFRDAVSRPNRIVVFEVGGIIKITSRIVVSSNITIAGQTAPGDGIVIYGNGFSFSVANNSIIRYLRMRMGVGGDSGKDAVTITDNAKNIIFDHVSVSWGRDENFSITGKADSITIQNSIIAQGLQNHSCGGLLEPSGALSLYRNLYIDNNTRNPKVKGINQFVNNVVYNWGVGGAYILGDSQGESFVNIINNYYIKGPSSTIRPFSRGTVTFVPYVDGNYYDSNVNGVLDGALVPQSDYEGITTFRDTPYNYPLPASLLTAQQAYDYVLANVGATYPFRDQVDAFLIGELMSLGRQGALIANEATLATKGPGEVLGAPAPPDTDRDGIPNAWELANGLNPNDPTDAKAINAMGYTNLEVYLNSMIETPAVDFLRPPSNVLVTALSPTALNITWKDNSTQENEFIIERSLDGIVYSPLTTVAANTIAYADTTLQPNKLYYYRIKASNDTEESIYSLPASARTLTIPSAPDVPISPAPVHNIRYVELTNVLLKWTGSANTITYHLHVGTDAANLLHIADITTPSYTITDLSENTTYYWRVDASNELGMTTGDTWSFTTIRNFPLGIVGNWMFDDATGTIITDSSEFLNHGELMDITDYAWVPGKENTALDLQRATPSTHIFISHEDQLYFNKNSFTISLWVKAPAQTSQSYLFHKGTFARNASTGATGKWFGMEVKDGKIRFSVDDDATKSEAVADNNIFFTNEWMHVVAVRDTENKKLRIYRNGILTAEANDNTVGGIGQTDPLMIGNSNDLNVPFRGVLDGYRVYNYSLTQTQILEIFHTSPLPIQPFDPTIADGSVVEGFDVVTLGWVGGINTTVYKLYTGLDQNNLSYIADVELDNPAYPLYNLAAGTTYYWRVDAIGPEGITTGSVWSFTTGFPKGLVGHWKLNETTGAIAHDNSNYNHAGKVIGFNEVKWNTEGKFDGSLLYELPADTASVKIPHASHLLFNNNSFTISLWVKTKANTYIFRNALGDDCYLIHKGTFEANTGKWYGIQLRDGRLTFAIDDGAVKTDLPIAVDVSSAQNIFTDQWKHIVAIRDTKNKLMKLYIDGVLVGQKTYTTGTIGRLTPVTIGNSAEKKPYRDLMDDVRLYNYALDPSQITSLYTGSPLVSNAFNPSPANDTTDVDPEEVILRWEGDAQSYNVYVGTSPETLELKASALSDPTFALNDLYNLKQYYWRVDALRDGELATGDVWTFKTSATSAGDNPNSLRFLYSYPNPFTTELNIEFRLLKDDHVKVTLYNLRGQVVHTFVNASLEKGVYKIQWNADSQEFSGLQRGLYTVVLQTSKYKLFNLVLRR